MLSAQLPSRTVKWLNALGDPISTGGGQPAVPAEIINRTIHGEKFGTVRDLQFRDPENFRARELHNQIEEWEKLADDVPTPQQRQTLSWIRNKVSVEPYFRPFTGQFKGHMYDSARPPQAKFRNNPSCRPFT